MTYYPQCVVLTLQCESGECLDESAKCDGKTDCLDGYSDEEMCPLPSECRQGEFKCDSGICVLNEVCFTHLTPNYFVFRKTIDLPRGYLEALSWLLTLPLRLPLDTEIDECCQWGGGKSNMLQNEIAQVTPLFSIS